MASAIRVIGGNGSSPWMQVKGNGKKKTVNRIYFSIIHTFVEKAIVGFSFKPSMKLMRYVYLSFTMR
ncbi:hypothetical protein REPUB_Repub17cG0115400 [Reevesia pubescens]